MAQLQDKAALVVRQPIFLRGASVIVAAIAAGMAVVIALAIATSPGVGTTAPNAQSRPWMATRVGADRDVGLIDARLYGAWKVSAAAGVVRDGGPDQDIGLMDFSAR